MGIKEYFSRENHFYSRLTILLLMIPTLAVCGVVYNTTTKTKERYLVHVLNDPTLEVIVGVWGLCIKIKLSVDALADAGKDFLGLKMKRFGVGDVAKGAEDVANKGNSAVEEASKTAEGAIETAKDAADDAIGGDGPPKWQCVDELSIPKEILDTVKKVKPDVKDPFETFAGKAAKALMKMFGPLNLVVAIALGGYILYFVTRWIFQQKGESLKEQLHGPLIARIYLLCVTLLNVFLCFCEIFFYVKIADVLGDNKFSDLLGKVTLNNGLLFGIAISGICLVFAQTFDFFIRLKRRLIQIPQRRISRPPSTHQSSESRSYSTDSKMPEAHEK